MVYGLEREGAFNITRLIALNSQERAYNLILKGVIPTKVALQPIINLRDSTVFGYEALARWQDFPPDLIFAQAVKHRTVEMLERLIVKRIHLIREFVPGFLFVNVYPSVTNPNLWDIFSGRNIVLEITEAQSINLRGVYRLREKGFPLALDDLGTGYSTFEALLELHPDFLKLDRVLTQSKNLQARDSLFVAMVEHARLTSAQVIVEGIETEEQLLAVKKAGCHFGQGYLLGKPQLFTQEGVGTG